MNAAQWVQNLVVLMFGAGTGGGLISFIFLRQRKRKLEADTDSVAVDTTEKAVLVLDKVIASLTTENARLKAHCEAIEAERDRALALIRAINERKYPDIGAEIEEV